MGLRRLNRATILDAALALADRDGLDKLSMRRLAEEVGASPMSLYRHFASKNALLDHMLDRLIGKLLPLESVGTGWQAEVLATARRTRTLLRDHPAWLPLFTRVVAPTSAIRLFEHFAGAMKKERISPGAKLNAISSLMCFTLGFVLVERMMSRSDGVVVPIEQLRAARSLFTPSFPLLAALGSSFDRWSFDAAFESGLSALVRDIESTRAAS